jgi:hypothetical protein
MLHVRVEELGALGRDRTMSPVGHQVEPAPQQQAVDRVRMGLVIDRNGGVASCGASHCG